MSTSPVVTGIDPAAPNGDASAMAVIQGTRIHQVIFDEVAKYQGDPRQLPPLGYQGTVTGRFKASALPLWNLPNTPRKSAMWDDTPRYKLYLFRKLELITSATSITGDLSAIHDAGQPGDVLLKISYMGKHRAYFWRGKKGHFWRQVNTRKHPELMSQLKMALMVQS